jgi:predicted Rossmann-fold nucleotide-binding protein
MEKDTKFELLTKKITQRVMEAKAKAAATNDKLFIGYVEGLEDAEEAAILIYEGMDKLVQFRKDKHRV